MKKKNIAQVNKVIQYLPVIAVLLIMFHITGCSSQRDNRQSEIPSEVIVTNEGLSGLAITLEFYRGPAHNHPLMAIWVQDTNGTYIETLYVARSIGTGIFEHGRESGGRWESGPVSRPAALPYWWHKYGYLPTPDKTVPDAITGPTPKAGFILNSVAVETIPSVFDVMLEINQPWDWNEYWTNDKYPDSKEYKTSSQPAVVYKARIDLKKGDPEILMQIIGHSHHAGENGDLNENMTTITTASKIAGSITVRIGNAGLKDS
ncbi:MAG TPA: hypothetical protein VK994_02080 [Bacteroidales bacterium]|nr:hypothetical protein [Bacteroidales bacterium]